MANYQYTAIAGDGRRIKGTQQADSVQELLSKLDEKNLSCVSCEAVETRQSSKTVYKMKRKDVIFFCRQMKTMLGAGITISRIFGVLRDKAEQPKMRQLYQNVYECLQKGDSLSGAMMAQGKSFPLLLMQMIASGETSGTLEKVMKRMEVYFNNDLKLVNKLRTAMIYPIMLVVVCIGVVVIIFSGVMPKMASMLEGMELPWNTRLLLTLSNFLTSYWFLVILGVILIALAAKGLKSTEHGKLLFDTLKFKIPKAGKLLKIIYTARFANSLATLYASGINMIRSLEISCEVLGNAYYTQQFVKVIEMVREGKSLAAAIESTPIFDSMFDTLVFVGEESGNLDEVLEQASEYYDQEAQVALERLVSLIEPVLILIMAFVVGFIMISVLIPIYQSYGTIA